MSPDPLPLPCMHRGLGLGMRLFPDMYVQILTKYSLNFVSGKHCTRCNQMLALTCTFTLWIGNWLLVCRLKNICQQRVCVAGILGPWKSMTNWITTLLTRPITVRMYVNHMEVRAYGVHYTYNTELTSMYRHRWSFDSEGMGTSRRSWNCCNNKIGPASLSRQSCSSKNYVRTRTLKLAVQMCIFS